MSIRPTSLVLCAGETVSAIAALQTEITQTQNDIDLRRKDLESSASGIEYALSDRANVNIGATEEALLDAAKAARDTPQTDLLDRIDELRASLQGMPTKIHEATIQGLQASTDLQNFPPGLIPFIASYLR